MKKLLFVALTGTLVAAMSLPAAAVETKVGGYFRLRGIIADLNQDKDKDPDKIYDQRFRAKVDMMLNEYVSVVYYGEVDMQYGDAGYGIGGTTRNGGGGLGGDTVNVESKNVYVAFKVPETPVAVTAGLQGHGDSFDSVIFNGDMAGLKAAGTFGPAKVTLGTFKWQEGSTGNSIGANSSENDIDLYTLQTAFSPMDGTTLGADVYWLNAQQDGGPANGNVVSIPKGDYAFLGLTGKTKAGPADLSGWFLFNTGTADDAAANGKDVDVQGWALSLKAAATFDTVKAALRGMYFSGDDDMTDTDYDSIVTPATTDCFPFYDAGMMIMLADVYGNTYFQNGYAYDDGVVAGYGMWGVTAKASTEMAGFHGQAAIGYFATTEDDQKVAGSKKEGKSLGTELNLRVGKKLADVVDVSLNGAVAFLGDFYDKTATGGKDPDNQYMAYLMVNVPY